MKKRPAPRIRICTLPPVKRQPAKKRSLKSLFAAIRGRNHRAATATAEDLEEQDRGLRISRGLTIIFGFHIVAIGLYFVHLKFLNDHTDAPAPPPAASSIATSSKPRTQSGAPLIAPDDKTCAVRAGDNYASIATREGVHVDDLRAANGDRPLAPNLTLILPQKRHTAGYPPDIQALRNPPAVASNNGLVPAVPVSAKAESDGILVRPKVVRQTINDPKPSNSTKPITTTKPITSPKPSTSPKATPTAGGSYVVKNGDSLWQISKRLKVDQTALMRANGIADPNKLKPGTTLSIPK